MRVHRRVQRRRDPDTRRRLVALAAAGAGIFWGWLRLRSGSLAATILCHLLWDLAVLALAPYGALL